MSSKTCRVCSETKPTSTCFYKHKQMADGHLNICIECVREQRRQHRIANRERIQEYDRRRGYHNTDPAKQRARRQVQHAIAQGRLTRLACEVCGASNAQAHHDDYDRALDVRWLCVPHHAEIHRTYA